MFNKNGSIVKNFDFDFNEFLTAVDWRIHHAAAANLADIFGAKKDYLEAVKSGRFNIAVLLMNMQDVGGNKSFSRVDRKAMVKIGELAADAYEKNDYHQVAVLADGIVFNNLADYLDLASQPDFKTITDQDLFSKGIIPNEIFFQYFILESLAKNKRFDWNRNEKIINQIFILAGICFADIYEWLGSD